LALSPRPACVRNPERARPRAGVCRSRPGHPGVRPRVTEHVTIEQARRVRGAALILSPNVRGTRRARRTARSPSFPIQAPFRIVTHVAPATRDLTTDYQRKLRQVWAGTTTTIVYGVEPVGRWPGSSFGASTAANRPLRQLATRDGSAAGVVAAEQEETSGSHETAHSEPPRRSGTPVDCGSPVTGGV
jgi:hypothetical protein